jgi:transposase, IS30 family
MGNSYEQLSAEERGVIMGMKSQGSSDRAIGRALGRDHSTIWRELRRNGYRSEAERGPMGRPTIAGGYDAHRAGQRARRLRGKARRERKLDPEGPLWSVVRQHLELEWSPEQIAGTLRSVSHQTIYTAIYAMPCGSLRRELTVLLRQGRAKQRPRSRGTERRGKMKDFLHPRTPAGSQRPAAAGALGRRLHQGGRQPLGGRNFGRPQFFVCDDCQDG